MKETCGCCTVLMDGKRVTSCMLLTVDCDGKDIVTIEGWLEDPEKGLDPLQQALLTSMRFSAVTVPRNHHGGQGASAGKIPSHGR